MKSLEIARWSNSLCDPLSLVVGVGIGLTVILTTFGSFQKIQSKEHYCYQTVDQPECYPQAEWDKIAKPTSSVRQCKGCGQHQDLSAFASKGRDRLSALCKSCDNKRRRKSYSPTITTPDWDHITVNLEAAVTEDKAKLAPLIWEMLNEHGFVCDGKNEFTDETIDSLLNRRSAIDGIIELNEERT
jgi:hypothetical protein